MMKSPLAQFSWIDQPLPNFLQVIFLVFLNTLFIIRLWGQLFFLRHSSTQLSFLHAPTTIFFFVNAPIVFLGGGGNLLLACCIKFVMMLRCVFEGSPLNFVHCSFAFSLTTEFFTGMGVSFIFSRMNSSNSPSMWWMWLFLCFWTHTAFCYIYCSTFGTFREYIPLPL